MALEEMKSQRVETRKKILKKALVSEEVRRDVGILVHLYQESIRISAAKSLPEGAKIELRQLLDSQVRLTFIIT